MNNALVSTLDPRALFRRHLRAPAPRRRARLHQPRGLSAASSGRSTCGRSSSAARGSSASTCRCPSRGRRPAIAFADRTGRPPRPGRAREVHGAAPSSSSSSEGIQSVCCVPLAVHDRSLGTLAVGPARWPAVQRRRRGAALRRGEPGGASRSRTSSPSRRSPTLKDKLAAEKVYLEEEIRTEHNFEEIVGRSRALKRVLHQVETVAPTDSTVLILGETGHRQGADRARHPRRAAGGASAPSSRSTAPPSRPGCSRASSSATSAARSPARSRSASAASSWRTAARSSSTRSATFPLELQPKLLRVLQEQQFERVGGTRTLRVDVRRGRGDQPQPRGRGRRRHVPQRPLLSPERLSDRRCRRCASGRRTSPSSCATACSASRDA